MPLLAIETSTERLSLALACDSRVLVRDIDAGQRHSELAIAQIRSLLDEASVTPAQLETIAFGQGPGSFVGVRIACGLAQGMALGAGIGVMPIATPLALAEQALATHHNAQNVFVAIDARMNEMYVAAYSRDEKEATGWRTMVAPALVDAQTLPPIDGDWIAIGSAFASAALARALQEKCRFTAVVERALPRASDVACLALRAIARGVKPVASNTAAPLYLRNNIALTIEQRAAAKLANAVPSASSIS